MNRKKKCQSTIVKRKKKNPQKGRKTRVLTEFCEDQWLLDLQIRIMSCEQGSYLKRAKYRLTPESFRKNKFWPSKQLISSMYLYNKLYFSNWKCWNIHCSLHKRSRLGTSFPKMFLEFLKSQLAKIFCFALTMKKQLKDMPLHPCPCSCCLDNRSGLPFPSLGDLPHSGMEPRSPALQVNSLPAEPPGKPRWRLPNSSHWWWVLSCRNSRARYHVLITGTTPTAEGGLLSSQRPH